MVGIALYSANGTTALPLGDVLGAPLQFVTAIVSQVAASFIKRDGSQLSSNDALFGSKNIVIRKKIVNKYHLIIFLLSFFPKRT